MEISIFKRVNVLDPKFLDIGILYGYWTSVSLVFWQVSRQPKSTRRTVLTESIS